MESNLMRNPPNIKRRKVNNFAKLTKNNALLPLFNLEKAIDSTSNLKPAFRVFSSGPWH